MEIKNLQYKKFCAYGFLRNLRFFEAFLMLFLLEKGMSFSQIGILYACKEIALNLFEIPSGVIADTWGRKYTLASSFIIFIISFLVFTYSYNFALFILAFVLFGFADAFRTGIHKAIMTDYLELKGWIEHRTWYYGNTRAWSQRGLAVSSLFAGLFVLYSGSYEYIFLFTIIPYLVSFALLLTYPNILNRALKTKKKSRWSQMAESWTNFFQIIKQPRVLLVVVNSASFTAFQRSVKDYLQPTLVAAFATLPVLLDLGLRQKNGLLIGFVFFCIYLLTAWASSASGKVKNNKLKRFSNITFLLGVCAGIFIGVFYEVKLWWLSIVFFALVFVVENLRKPTVTSLVSEEVPTKNLASVLSAQSQIRTIISAFISVALGYLADWLGIGVALILVSVGVMTIYLFIRNCTTRRSVKI